MVIGVIYIYENLYFQFLTKIFKLVFELKLSAMRD